MEKIPCNLIPRSQNRVWKFAAQLLFLQKNPEEQADILGSREYAIPSLPLHLFNLFQAFMEDPLIESTLQALQKNKFNAYLAESPQKANRIFFEKILPTLQVRTYTWGDSMTMRATGVLEELGKQSDKVPILTFDASFSQTQKIYWRKQALLADLFLTGTNALTQKGQLVNLDMIGNRIGGINFGPENVVIFVGINKIVPDIEAAMNRIRIIAAPKNAARHSGFHTPCIKTGTCMDCQSPDRICNSWLITEKSYPKGRISVILIKQELGL